MIPLIAAGAMYLSSPLSRRLLRGRRYVAVCESRQEGHDLIFLLIGQAKAPHGLIDVRSHFRGGPARDLLARVVRSLASRQNIAGIIEVDDFFQTLQIAIMHVSLHEIRTRPLIHVS